MKIQGQCSMSPYILVVAMDIGFFCYNGFIYIVLYYNKFAIRFFYVNLCGLIF